MNDYQKYEEVLTKERIVSANTPEDKNKPDSSRFAVISPCFYKEIPEMAIHTKNMLDREGITYIPYGLKEPFTNKVASNILSLYETIQEYENQYDEILVMDAYDTFYLGGETILMLLSRYRNLIKNLTHDCLVIGSEKECYPKGSEIFYAHMKEKPERYLNAGMILSKTSLLQVILEEMINKYQLDLLRYEKDADLTHHQNYWHRYITGGKLKSFILVDDISKYFYSMDSQDPYLSLELLNPLKIRVREHGTTPKIFHFNRCFNDTYKQFFGEFWVETLDALGKD
jgi:hypothetical protein